ncbi:MAG: hypothetical protein U1F43_00465 [Myxococcota bacterium]
MASLNARAQTLGSACSIQGIPFEAGTQVFFGLSDELVLCVLPTDQTIASIPCQKGLVHFHPNGALAQATISRDHVERGLPFKRGTLLSWNEDGTLGAHVGESHAFDGVVVPAGASLRLDEGGRLISWSRRLAVEETVGGLACQGGSVVTCFADGRPERLTLSRSQVVDAIPVMGGTDLELHSNGHVAAATLAEAHEVAGVRFEAGTTLVFRPTGSLSVAQLAEDMDIGGRTFVDGTYLSFDEVGNLTESAAITWEVHRVARG